MKARIKATGEIVDIAEYSTIYAENYDTCFYPNELEFLENSEDYWTRLEHTYAGMAMQGIMANSLFMPYDGKEIADISNDIATTLVEKMKEERK